MVSRQSPVISSRNLILVISDRDSTPTGTIQYMTPQCLAPKEIRVHMPAARALMNYLKKRGTPQGYLMGRQLPPANCGIIVDRYDPGRIGGGSTVVIKGDVVISITGGDLLRVYENLLQVIVFTFISSFWGVSH